MLGRDDGVVVDTASVKELQSEEEKDDEVPDEEVSLCMTLQ